MKKLFYVLAILIGFSARAQETFSISAKVTDQKGGIIPGAVVYLNNSQKSTSSNADGLFSLNDLGPGTYDLVVKMIGFNVYDKTVTIQNQSINLSIKLSESSTALREVRIKGKSDADHQKYIKLFTKNFIGESPNAALSKILNPEVLKFNYDKKTDLLEASANDFITIENRSLGYAVKYLLSHFQLNTKTNLFSFDGKLYFEALEGSETEQKQWVYNRQVTYQGSSRHFFKALFNHTAEAEGFLTFQFSSKLPIRQLVNEKPITPDSLFATADDNLKVLKLASVREPNPDNNKLYVVYTRKAEPDAFYKLDAHLELLARLPGKKNQISQIIPNADDLVFDKNGTITPAEKIRFNGYWSWERVADLMPSEYSFGTPKIAWPKLRALITSLDSFRNKLPVEKVHLHFDKPYYARGDTIWLKGYVVNERNELSTLSNILYVDLVDDKNAIKKRLRLPLTYGLGWGNMALTDSLLKAGKYHIHAYTSWMRNYNTSSGYVFDKPITIGDAMNAQNTDNNAQANNSADGSVQFFPEGGELVNEIPSKVGYKAIGTDGLSRPITGYIIDKSNNHITTFKSEHGGMGTFTLTPTAGNSYTAVVKFENGNEKRFELPQASQQGYTLSITEDEENIAVKVNASDKLLGSGDILLIAQTNNIVQYTGQQTLTGTSFNTVIPKSRFPEGITQFTLFSPDYQAVAERLVFIRHNDAHLKISITPDKSSYKPREKVHLGIAVTDKDGTPVMGSFSFAINDASKVPNDENDETTIFSNLLLSSELKGYIEQPNYYFVTDSTSQDIRADKERQLDNLVLTQGWRRFIWKDILANTAPVINYQAEKSISLSGKVLTKNGKPVPNAKVFVVINSGKLMIDTVTNAAGAFNFDRLGLKKGTPFTVNAQDAKGNKNLKVEIDKQLPDPIVFEEAPVDPPVNDNFTAYLNNDRIRLNEITKNDLIIKSKMLKEVAIKDAAIKHSSNLTAHGAADQTITFMDLLGCQEDLTLCLAGRLNNVRVGRDSTGSSVIFARNFGSFGQETIPASTGSPGETKTVFIPQPMLIIVDGVQGRSISDVPSSQVASVEVMRGGGAATLYGARGENGVLVITTKTGDVDYGSFEDQRYHNDAGAKKAFTVYNFQGGYDMRREFYSPNYDNPMINKQMADLRTTIYWAPNIMTDPTGKASVDFFNADGSGNYRVTAEGLDQQGRLARQVYQYAVK